MEDTPLIVDAATGVLANDQGSGILSAWEFTTPMHGTLALAADGSFTYIPAANFHGVDVFTYRDSDGMTFSPAAAVTITVTSVNDAPTGVADAASTDVLVPVTIDVLANDTDVDGDPLTIASFTQPHGGTVAMQTNGLLAYTPAAGFAGSDGFQYVVSDGQGGTTTVPVAVSVHMPIDLDSVDPAGAPSAGFCESPSISGDGRFVSFDTWGALVSGDTNGWGDVFVRDRASAATTRASVSSAGGQGNSFSNLAVISSSGRFVAFTSAATNLVANDLFGRSDVFVRDLVANTTEMVDVSSSGTQGSGGAGWPSLSADGRYVAFSSSSPDLVAGDTNNTTDIFVRDRVAGSTERVSVDSTGTEANGFSEFPAISADGRFVAFVSVATNLIANDTNGGSVDVFVHDRQTGTTELASQRTDGVQPEYGVQYTRPTISADGRFVAFGALSANLDPADAGVLVNRIYLRDRVAGTLEVVSVPIPGVPHLYDSSVEPSISGDGRYVSFRSAAYGLVAGLSPSHQEIFVRDRLAATTAEVSLSADGVEANGDSVAPQLSANGRYVVFLSIAQNLANLPPATNPAYQVYTVRNSLAP